MTTGPQRNRVTPSGDIVAIPLRGAWLGNRGILHEGRRIVRFHASNLWITCALRHKDWRLPQWQPHHFTVLFFHDEAVSLAAGHRPCALCRRSDYDRFRTAMSTELGIDVPRAAELDRRLHRERIVKGTHRRVIHRLPWREVPSGAFAVLDGQPMIVHGEAVVGWSHDGYGAALARPSSGDAHVLTPPSSLAALRGGYAPQIDEGAILATR